MRNAAIMTVGKSEKRRSCVGVGRIMADTLVENIHSALPFNQMGAEREGGFIG